MYDKSWNALEQIREVLNSKSNLDSLQHNKQFCSLLKSCAVELSNSFMVDSKALLETNINNESSQLFQFKDEELQKIEMNVLGAQQNIDEKINKLFPCSTGGRTRTMKISQEETIKAQQELKQQLKEYRKNITTKHLLACMPSR